jgi:hypothetical protein
VTLEALDQAVRRAQLEGASKLRLAAALGAGTVQLRALVTAYGRTRDPAVVEMVLTRQTAAAAVKAEDSVADEMPPWLARADGLSRSGLVSGFHTGPGRGGRGPLRRSRAGAAPRLVPGDRGDGQRDGDQG